MKDAANDFQTDIVYLDDESDKNELEQEGFAEDYGKSAVKSGPSVKKRRSKRRGRKSVPSVPVGKAVKGTGKIVSKTVGILFRLSTFLLIGYILYLLGTNFWKGKNAFGELSLLIADQNYSLIAYLVTSFVILLYELCSLIWSFSMKKYKEYDRVQKRDTGRGFCSFLLIYAGALASQFFAHRIPSAPAFLTGVRGALNIYGSLAGALLPLCAAGVVCTLLRKIVFR